MSEDQGLVTTEAEKAPPQFAYFHYVTPGSTLAKHHHGYVETYVMHGSAIGPGAKLEQLIPVWAQKAKNREIEPCGWAFGDVRWRRESYLVVVIDVPGFKFDSADAFEITGGGHTIGAKTLIDFTTADGTAMQAIYCVNHFRKQDGSTLGDHDRDDFDPVRLTFTSVASAGSDVAMSTTHDDVGTNIGPRRP